MGDDVQQDVTVASASAPDKVFDNPVVQEQWALTVKHIAYGLIGLAAFAMAGVFVLAFRGDVPDTIVLLGTTVATGCISGLVGYIAGRNTSQEAAQ